MPDLPGSVPEMPSRASKGNLPTETTSSTVSDADKLRLLKRAVGVVYGEKKHNFVKKGPKLSGLKAVAEWRDSDEVKNMGEGATLVQGLEADKKKKQKETEAPPAPEQPPPSDDKNPEPAPVPPAEDVIVPPALKTDFGVGIVSDPTRVEQEIGGLAQHDRAREKPARGFLRSLITPITNPREFIRNFWQNTLFKGSFDARSMSFSRTMMEIARSQLSGLDSTVPFQMPQEILDMAIEEGRKVKKAEKLPTKVLNGIKDLFSGTFAVTQNSDMRYAEKWFADHGVELVTGAKKVSIGEQTQLGERFAIRGDNRDVISQEVGEVRFRLEEAIPDPAVRSGLQAKIKELVGLYGQKQIDDEELLKRFNQYYHKEIIPKIDPAKREEIEGIEVSSNVLRIAQEMLVEDRVSKDTVKTRYQRYQEEKSDDGESMWSKLHFDIYIGRGKYEVARGEVRLSDTEKRLIHAMVERDYKLANGLIGHSAVEMLSDAGIYTLAYVAGAGGAFAMAGRSALNLGGPIGVSAIAAAREGVLVSRKGKLYGIRGKAVTDFEQVSRETAIGRKSMDKARLRPQFEGAMVDQRHANELSAPIFELASKPNLSEAEQKQLLQALAQAKARLTLTDLSTKKGRAILDVVGEISVAQNFVGYSQESRNAEMTALRAAIVQGGARLAAENPALYAKLQQAQAVYEAQLKIGSFENKLAGVVAKDLGIGQDEARSAVAEFYEDMGIDNKSRKSLYAASKTLAGVVDRRAATTAAFAAVVSPIMGAELHLANEAFLGAKALFAGNLDAWSADWGTVVGGDVPLTYDNGHNLVSDLSPLQKDSLWIHNIVTPPPITPHTEIIDGVSITLPGGVQHGHVVGDVNADALVDAKTGEVLVNMDNSHLAYEDLNGDGTPEAVIKIDSTGQTVDAATAFSNFDGIKLVQDQNLNQTINSSETVFKAQQQYDQTITVDGKPVTVNVPGNTHWEEDTQSGKWDLVGTKVDGTTIKLIDDATISSNGEINTAGANLDPSVHIEAGQTAVNPSENIWNRAENYRIVWGEGGRDSLPVRDFMFRTGDPENPYGVEIRFNETSVRNTNNGEITSLQSHYEDGSMGMVIEVKDLVQGNNDGHVLLTGIFDREEINGSTYYTLRLDPTSTESVTLSDGTVTTMGEISRALLNQEELAKYQLGELASEMTVEGFKVFNLANNGHNGHLLMGFVTDGDPRGHDQISGQEQLFMPIHVLSGSSPANLTEATLPPEPSFNPVITVGDITSQSSQTDLGYRIEYEGNNNLPPFLIPVPMRQNIEKSVKGQPSSPTPVSTAQSTTSVPPAKKPEEKGPEESPPEEKKVEIKSEREQRAEERKAFAKKLEEKTKERKQLEDSIEARKKPRTPEEGEAIKKLDEEIAELEISLYDPTKRKEAKIDEEQVYAERYDIVAGADRGEKRKDKASEDSYGGFTITIETKNKEGKEEVEREALLILSDGVGGQSEGKLASSTIVREIHRLYGEARQSLESSNDLTVKTWTPAQKRERALRAAIIEANNILVRNNKRDGIKSAATVVVAVLGKDGEYVVGNAGDSRAYLISDAQARQITKDHSIVQGLIDAGAMTEEERYESTIKNKITRACGREDDANFAPDMFTGTIGTNEQLLLCSDGLWEMTRDADGSVIKRLSRGPVRTLEKEVNKQKIQYQKIDQTTAVARLLSTAIRNGGDDNIALMMARRIS